MPRQPACMHPADPPATEHRNRSYARHHVVSFKPASLRKRARLARPNLAYTSGLAFAGSCSASMTTHPRISGQRPEYRGVIHHAVAGHGVDAFDHAFEKTPVLGAGAGHHLTPHVLGVNMTDTFAVACGELGGIGAAPCRMAGIEQEMNGVRRVRHQRIDVGLVLHHRSHVMVVDETDAFAKRCVSDFAHAAAELGPLPGLQHRPP